MTQKLIVIGAGMASGRVLEHLLEAHADYDITLYNAEARGTITVSCCRLFCRVKKPMRTS